MKYFVLTLLLIGVAILATTANPVQPAAHEEPPAEEYDVAIEEEFIEEPTTTVRPARRSRPSARREKTTKSEPAPTTTTTTEKPTKRTRTTTSSSAARTTTKASGDAVEAVTSTYRRPKFPPRKLPGPTRKPTPPPEEIIEDPAALPAEEGLPVEGDPLDAPVEEEFVEEVR